MDSKDQRSAVSSLVAILRKITRAVQLIPFAYLLLLAICLLAESVLPDWALRIADNTLNTPIIAVSCMLGAGRLLKLCAWFRTACLLPIVTKVEGYIDSFIITFTQDEVVLINFFTGLSFLIFIHIAFRHFFYGRKGHA